MPLSSKAGRRPIYRTFLATRPSTGALFRMPVLVSELVYPDRSTVDGFLTDDGLTMFFSSSPFQFPPDAGRAPVMPGRPSTEGRRRRRICTSPGGRRSTPRSRSTQPLDDLNTGGDERDPWLTPDGKTLYFTSDRDGALTIYTAAVKPR